MNTRKLLYQLARRIHLRAVSEGKNENAKKAHPLIRSALTEIFQFSSMPNSALINIYPRT